MLSAMVWMSFRNDSMTQNSFYKKCVNEIFLPLNEKKTSLNSTSAVSPLKLKIRYLSPKTERTLEKWIPNFIGQFLILF